MKEQTRIADSENGFYDSHFSLLERARLADLDDPNNLNGEIALLRVLIRRHFAGPPIDQLRDGRATLPVDVNKLCRYLDTLCRAIKTARLVRDNPDDGMSDALKEILTQLEAEQQAKDARALAPVLPTPGSPRNPGPADDPGAMRR